MSFARDLVAKSTPPPVKKPDGRVTNQYGVVYFMNDGSKSTAEKLSNFYGVGRNLIQKIYKENKKDYLISNKAIEDYILTLA